jgi:H+/gluconate symporter-like permease
MEIISIIGMIAALILLSYLVMKGVNIFIVAISCSLVVALTGGLGAYESLKVNYMSGFVGFIQGNFLIFLAGALMGKAYEITNGAKAVAKFIINKLGKNLAVISVPVATGALTYGGIAGFVIVFAIFPIALEIFREADIPRRFIPVSLIFGCCTFSGLGPGSPQVANVVLINALGTTLMAGAVVGFIAAAVILVLGLFMLVKMVNKAKANGEHFVAKPMDKFNDEVELPNGLVALIPLLVTIITINIKINGATLIPVEFGVTGGAVLAYILLRKYVQDNTPLMDHIGGGVRNAITSVSNTSSVVGFGAVVQGAVGFPVVVDAMLSIPGPDLIAIALATTVIAGVCGSGSGGLGIAAPILQPIFNARGVTSEILHRTMAVASSGLDTLPHNGFVVTVLNGVCNESHKDAYMPVFWMTVVTPLLTTALTIVLFTLFPHWP